MSVIRMKDQTDGSVLVSRSAAANVSGVVETALGEDAHTLEFDFEGIRVLAPSFLDQLLIVTERIEATMGLEADVTIVFRNCPSGMHEKLSAIARAHDADAAVQADGTWIMRRFV
jgi:hypothetical protein